MTSPTSTHDGLTRGELQFAIVETFNADTLPDEDSVNVRGLPYYGDGSRDMTGTVRLMDGTVLPFRYIDGRFPTRDDDGTMHFDEDRYVPTKDRRGMSWPIEGYAIMVEVEGDRVRRWVWPQLMLNNVYGVADYRYLQPPAYSRKVHYPGLHCVVDLSKLDRDYANALVTEADSDFPPSVVYIGHHTDDYLDQVTGSRHLAIFTWDEATRQMGAAVVIKQG